MIIHRIPAQLLFELKQRTVFVNQQHFQASHLRKIFHMLNCQRLAKAGMMCAHELDAEVSAADAETLLALCDAIIGYVYEAPQLVQRIQERLTKSKDKA